MQYQKSLVQFPIHLLLVWRCVYLWRSIPIWMNLQLCTRKYPNSGVLRYRLVFEILHWGSKGELVASWSYDFDSVCSRTWKWAEINRDGCRLASSQKKDSRLSSLATWGWSSLLGRLKVTHSAGQIFSRISHCEHASVVVVVLIIIENWYSKNWCWSGGLDLRSVIKTREPHIQHGA